MLPQLHSNGPGVHHIHEQSEAPGPQVAGGEGRGRVGGAGWVGQGVGHWNGWEGV